VAHLHLPAGDLPAADEVLAQFRDDGARACRGCHPAQPGTADVDTRELPGLNTVKTHQRMIYRKLGGDGRRDAIRRAKELRLL
jgi:hypothetical protein